MPPATLSLPCSTAALRIGVADPSLATLSITFCLMALPSVSPALLRYRLHRGRDGRDQRGHVSRQCGVVLERFYRRIDRAAAIVTQNKDQRRTKHGNGIFQTRDGFIVGEIAGHAANEKIAPAAVESVFGRDARIGAAQDGGVGVLAPDQRFPLMFEVVPQRNALDVARIAFQQAFERSARRQHVLRFRRRLRLPWRQPRSPTTAPLSRPHRQARLRREGSNLEVEF